MREEREEGIVCSFMIMGIVGRIGFVIAPLFAAYLSAFIELIQAPGGAVVQCLMD